MHAAVRILLLCTVLTLPVAGFAASVTPDISSSVLRDHHGRIARSSTAKNAFKKDHPCRATSLPRGPCPGYVIDHIVALKRGGPDAPANMQWQTIADAKAKDRWE